MIQWNTASLALFAQQMERAKGELRSNASKTVGEAGVHVRDQWKANATVTAGRHGKHYPKSIKDHRVGLLSTKVEPDASMMQGGMSFEEGSSKQPPHLDGLRALIAEEPKFETALSAAAAAAMNFI